MNIREEVLEIEKNLTEMRRDLHKIPEMGLKEFKTTKYIREKLKEYGINYTEVSETGTKGVIMVPDAKKTLAFRADIDGLPINEENDVSFKSQHEGMMHACGHDGHTSTLLCFAKICAENKDKLKHNVVFVFQPAEEGDGGARLLVKSGVLENPKIDFIYGFHLSVLYDEGVLAFREGESSAANFMFDVEIKGKNSHGARPQDGIDAVYAMGELITSLQQISSRNINPFKPFVLTIGTASAGSKRNIIGDSGKIEATIRCFDKESEEISKRRVEEVVKGVSISTGAEMKLMWNDIWFDTLYNEKEIVDKLRALVPENDYVHAQPLTGSEDFSEYLNFTKGGYFYVGIRNEKEKIGMAPGHTPRYNFNEKCLLPVVEMFCRIADLS